MFNPTLIVIEAFIGELRTANAVPKSVGRSENSTKAKTVAA
jgi:hypothetical protein